MNKKSYLVDFLKSFELVTVIDDFLDDKEQTLLDRIMPAAYKQAVLSYSESLKAQDSIFGRFVTRDYNLLLALLFQMDSLEDFGTYRQFLVQQTLSSFVELLEQTFSLSYLEKGYHQLEELDLLPTNKWYLFTILSDFETKKEELLEALDRQYVLYCQQADYLYRTYEDKINRLQESLSQSENLYPLIFKEVLSEEEYHSRKDCFILLLSGHYLLVHYKKNHRLIALGLYVYDYYLEVERQKTINQETAQTVLKVLADPTRYGIMKCIEKGMTSNKEIAQLFSISPSGVTYQTKFLLENQMIKTNPETKNYQLNRELIAQALTNVLLDLGIVAENGRE